MISECGLIYVAHSLPASFIEQGDPYLDRTRATVRAVHRELETALDAAGHGSWLARIAGGADPQPAFQSKVGPIKWLGPEVAEETPRLIDKGLRSLFVQPVSFTCEHVETMLELGVELKEIAEKAGIADFKRGPALNLNRTWLESMAVLLTEQAFSPEVGSIVADD